MSKPMSKRATEQAFLAFIKIAMSAGVKSDAAYYAAEALYGNRGYVIGRLNWADPVEAKPQLFQEHLRGRTTPGILTAENFRENMDHEFEWYVPGLPRDVRVTILKANHVKAWSYFCNPYFPDMMEWGRLRLVLIDITDSHSVVLVCNEQSDLLPIISAWSHHESVVEG